MAKNFKYEPRVMNSRTLQVTYQACGRWCQQHRRLRQSQTGRHELAALSATLRTHNMMLKVAARTESDSGVCSGGVRWNSECSVPEAVSETAQKGHSVTISTMLKQTDPESLTPSVAKVCWTERTRRDAWW